MVPVHVSQSTVADRTLQSCTTVFTFLKWYLLGARGVRAEVGVYPAIRVVRVNDERLRWSAKDCRGLSKFNMASKCLRSDLLEFLQPTTVSSYSTQPNAPPHVRMTVQVARGSCG